MLRFRASAFKFLVIIENYVGSLVLFNVELIANIGVPWIKPWIKLEMFLTWLLYLYKRCKLCRLNIAKRDRRAHSVSFSQFLQRIAQKFEMEWRMHYIIIFHLIIPLIRTQYPQHTPFSPEFLDMMMSSNATDEKSAISRRFFRELAYFNFMYNFNINITAGPPTKGNSKDCPRRLLHIMTEHLKCPRTANEMEPYFIMMELFFNSIHTILDLLGDMSNCDELIGEDANHCRKLSNLSPDIFKVMDNITDVCFIDYKSTEDTNTTFRSKKL